LEVAMIANHIHDALRQVESMRAMALERARFCGYSGRARMLGGVVALCGALVLSRPSYPSEPLAHLAGWSVVMVLALLANYGGLFRWFLSDPAAARDRVQLLPALDACPTFLAAGLLSAALILQGQYNLLFGVWMGMFGLVHAAYRRNLPPANLAVGLFYGFAGAICLFHPAVRFVNPWPMGLVFFAGEISGGFVLMKGRAPMLVLDGEEVCDV
jgi:hypothetical protein